MARAKLKTTVNNASVAAYMAAMSNLQSSKKTQKSFYH